MGAIVILKEKSGYFFRYFCHDKNVPILVRFVKNIIGEYLKKSGGRPLTKKSDQSPNLGERDAPNNGMTYQI